MRTHGVVVLAPHLDLRSSVVQVVEDVRVQALVAHLAVEGLHEGVLDGFARFDEVQLDAALVGPLVQSAAGEFGAVVDDDDLGQSVDLSRLVESSGHAESRDGGVDLDGGALACAVVDDVQRSHALARAQAVAHEVHGPSAMRTVRQRNRPARCSRGSFSPLAPAQLQLLFPVQPVDPLAVEAQALAPQQRVEFRVAEAWSLRSELDQTLSQAARLLATPDVP